MSTRLLLFPLYREGLNYEYRDAKDLFYREIDLQLEKLGYAGGPKSVRNPPLVRASKSRLSFQATETDEKVERGESAVKSHSPNVQVDCLRVLI